MIELEWEDIDDQHKRAAVFGGWLVKATEEVFHGEQDRGPFGYDWRVSMTFVPDLGHVWGKTS